MSAFRVRSVGTIFGPAIVAGVICIAMVVLFVFAVIGAWGHNEPNIDDIRRCEQAWERYRTAENDAVIPQVLTENWCFDRIAEDD